MVTPLLAMHLSNAAISVARFEPAVVEVDVDADEDVAAALVGVDELLVDEQPVNTAASTAAPPTPMVTRRIYMKTPSRSFGSPHPLRR